MPLSHGPGIFSFHSHVEVHASYFRGCQDDKIWGQPRERAGDAGRVKAAPPRALPGGCSPGTAPPSHCQALGHNWLKIDWDRGGVGGNYLRLENLWLKFPF